MALSGPALAAGEPLVVYTARKYQLVEQLFQEYGRERGIEVKFVTDDGAPLIQRLTAEGANEPGGRVHLRRCGRPVARDRGGSARSP